MTDDQRTTVVPGWFFDWLADDGDEELVDYCNRRRAEDVEWAEAYGDDIAAYFVTHPPVPREVRVEKLRRLLGQGDAADG